MSVARRAASAVTPCILALCILALCILPLCILGACSRDRPRAPAAAGEFYPADPAALRAEVDALLDHADPPLASARTLAIVAPHAGYALSGATAARAFRAVRGQAFARVLVLGPAHDIPAKGALLDDATSYVTPLGPVPVDVEARKALFANPMFANAPKTSGREHAIEVELPFLQRALAPGFRLVPVLLGDVDASTARAIADALRPLAEGALVVASSDFTHAGKKYGFEPFGADPSIGASVRALDLGLFLAVARGPDAAAKEAASARVNACGLSALLVLAALLPKDARVGVLAQATSFDADADATDVVGYVGATFTSPAP